MRIKGNCVIFYYSRDSGSWAPNWNRLPSSKIGNRVDGLVPSGWNLISYYRENIPEGVVHPPYVVEV
jgi:hypothetical protein